VLLAGENGDRLEVTVVGYEFPAIEGDEYDSNWLNIRISATNDRGSWTATHPSLTTGDVATLADWLQAIADEKDVNAKLGFLEPNLSFELVDRNDRVRLRAWFELESRPRWAHSAIAGERDLCVDLVLRRDDLRAAAASLRAQLRRFPPRAGLR
jgi:hypothetical protein